VGSSLKKVGNRLQFLLNLESDFEEWRKLAEEWLNELDGSESANQIRIRSLTKFFEDYLHNQQIDRKPSAIYQSTTTLPNLWETLKLDPLNAYSGQRLHDIIVDFLDWVLKTKLTERNAKGQLSVPRLLKNPFKRLVSKKLWAKIDPHFNFLLSLDPSFEEWRQLAEQWWKKEGPEHRHKCASVNHFFVDYLFEQQIDKRPEFIFRRDAKLSNLWDTLKFGTFSGNNGDSRHDAIVDFLDWVLRAKFSEQDADGHLIVPNHLHNPFTRRKTKTVGKLSDLTLSHVLIHDPKMADWQQLSAEWLAGETKNLGKRIKAFDKFLVDYIVGLNLDRNPIKFLTRSTENPSFNESLIATQKRGQVGTMNEGIVIRNNIIHDFLEWVLKEKLSIEYEHGQRRIPPQLHNPVQRLSRTGMATLTESVRSPLSIRYIKELREMLAEGPNFRDWKWVQQTMESARHGGDWFVVDSNIINPDDPDCVWHERLVSKYERDTLKMPEKVTELWSPVRAVALYIKLELPIRGFQLRMLDSGEADTWRYEHGINGGKFVLNDSPLATGSESRPCQRGVFHRDRFESGAGLFINTNKTADINKPEHEKGYVIPWTHETVLYWLDKLRNWQERYNPITEPMPWLNLERKHFGDTVPHSKILSARGASCFLFRNAAGKPKDRQKPLDTFSFNRTWYRLLDRLEKKCLDRGETLDDGSPIVFVDHSTDSTTYYPIHSLRVSLISYLVLDLQLPLPIVSKLIAGHSSIIMTLYYTKFGKAYMNEVLAEAERKQFQADQINHARFLMDASLAQVEQRFASLSVDGMHAAISQKSSAGFVFEDKGICPVGGSMCDVGGEPLNEQKDQPRKTIYAPVPGYPQERNCVRCRFFLTGPAFLPGLQAHFNAISYYAHERSERHNDLQNEVNQLENRRAECEVDGRIFTETRELTRLSQRYEAEAEAVGKLINDMQATYYLIARSIDILKHSEKDGVQLIATGGMSDIEQAFTETSSELHQIEVICENAVIYPEIDARKPALRRSQLLDIMLEFNSIPPIFFHLDPKQQLAAGNAVMKLIQARAGSLKGALEYVEGHRRLQELGIVDETLDAIAEVTASIPAREIMSTATFKRLPTLEGNDNAS